MLGHNVEQDALGVVLVVAVYVDVEPLAPVGNVLALCSQSVNYYLACDKPHQRDLGVGGLGALAKRYPRRILYSPIH